jgi:hypothetical protein
MVAMTGRIYELDTQRECGTEMEQWTVQPIYAKQPVQIIKPAPTTIRCIAHQ